MAILSNFPSAVVVTHLPYSSGLSSTVIPILLRLSTVRS